MDQLSPQGRRLTLDTQNQTLRITGEGHDRELPLYSKGAFEALSREWVRIGWSLRYYHTFTWLGRAILQLPEDLIRLQEVVYNLQPDLIIETGVFDGGSLLFYAGLFETLGKGRVLGIDIELRPGVREALAAHRLAHRIELLEGSSTSPDILAAVSQRIPPGGTVMVMLDSNHTKAHVAAELEAYAPFVTQGSCIVAADGIMQDLADVPGGDPSWRTDNPAAAAQEFAADHPEFQLRQPPWAPNVSKLDQNITYWPHAWLWKTAPNKI